jgi:hypothetical protein
MNEETNLELSRLSATAKSLGAMAANNHSFTDKAVLLTGEPGILETSNGALCFLNSLRLLLRMITKLTIWLPSSGRLAEATSQEVQRIAYGWKPDIRVASTIDHSRFDAILSIGTQGRVDLPWTVVNSNGWVARASSCGGELAAECGQANAIGALGAASWGVAEVFKRLIELRPERGEMSPMRCFSFFDYSESNNPGPVLPKEIPIDLVLFGAGAIGNGIVHLLLELPVVGNVVVVDNQTFQRENWGTCFGIGPREFGVPKANWASQLLEKKLTAGWLHGSVEDYIAKCGKVYSYPRLALDALDTIAARRQVQSLWPDQIIDGAIGPTICEVTLHPWNGNCSCLRCDFQEAEVDALELQARASGLSPSRLASLSSYVTEADVNAAPEHLKDWLKRRQGKQICSVVSEAVLASLSLKKPDEGFEPSAPFVACQSSCMVVGEALRYSLGWEPMLHTGFQFDSLVGPQNGVRKIHFRKSECECVQRRQNIEHVREIRLKRRCF